MTTQGDREDVSVPTVDPSGKAVQPWQVVVLDGLIRLYFKSLSPNVWFAAHPKALATSKPTSPLGPGGTPTHLLQIATSAVQLL